METTTGGSPPARAARGPASTVDDEVKATASARPAAATRLGAWAHRPPCGRPRPRRPASPWPGGRRPGPPARSRPGGTGPSPATTGDGRRKPRPAPRPATRSGTRSAVPAPSAGRGPFPGPPRPTGPRTAPPGHPARPRSRSTALGEVQRHPLVGTRDQTVGRPDRARAPPSAGSSMAMTGSSTTSAPRSAEPIHQGRGLGTGCGSPPPPRPASGRGHRPPARRPAPEPRSSAATGPTTMIEGAGSSTAASPARVVRTTCCRSVVPQCTTATGVSGRARCRSARRRSGPAPPCPSGPPASPRPGRAHPVDPAGRRGVAHVAGDHGDRRGQSPVGDRDAGRGRNGEGRAHPGHHLVARSRRPAAPRPPRRPGRRRRGRHP